MGLTNTQLRDELREDIKEVLTLAKENQRTLRGNNGNIGLVTQVSSLAAQVNAIVTTHLPALKSDIMHEIAQDREKAVTYPKVASWIGPIISGVVVAILVSVIHALFF